MTNKWIINVIADLERFAKANGLPELAFQLDRTRLTAEAELELTDYKNSTSASDQMRH
ncbi:MAG: hypothetical protein P8N51_10570 [Pseudomonadales bacterium]|jgi:hypothetical protein|nr:hypothetical protein [Pseudomonadales bacterium]MDG1459811.1 hypothetical protein [Pseudoprimorskyibacter sp.]